MPPSPPTEVPPLTLTLVAPAPPPPRLGYHFWMSTFTVVHHTAPHIPFKGGKDWDAAKAQLGGTVHCDFPRWVEFLCHDISVHVPHHGEGRGDWPPLVSP